MPKKLTARALLDLFRQLPPQEQENFCCALSQHRPRGEDSQRWMPPSHAAAWLGIHRATVWRRVEAGVLICNGFRNKRSRICGYSVASELLYGAVDRLSEIDPLEVAGRLRSSLNELIINQYEIEALVESYLKNPGRLQALRPRIEKCLMEQDPLYSPAKRDAYSRQANSGLEDAVFGEERRYGDQLRIIVELNSVADILRSMGHPKGRPFPWIDKAKKELRGRAPDLSFVADSLFTAADKVYELRQDK